ncbi:hypothetical protein GQX74_011014 [Glossina fuscipes]|nr:hypothetical protein GQX74_011014 [Glossina fuscipes]
MSEASTGSPGDATAAASTPMASTTAATMPSPSVVADHSKAANYEFDSSLSEEERRFYLKAYPTIDVVRERKVHCTVCKTHIGTAPIQESNIKMHPILRVTHCVKCHDFYNSGEFSKGEDGSELYCRWCGQGGEVYCCSSCPYVFCKSCIVKNLSRGVVVDIEQNENWSCFSCAPKILWPLRAQHWALIEIYALNLSETELKQQLSTDRSKCCRLAKAKCGNMSDSLESLDSVTSKRSFSSNSSAKKKHASAPSPQPSAKRPRNNDDIVCTPDLMSMLEPDCQITVSQKLPTRPLPTPAASAPKILSIKPGFPGASNIMTSTPKSSVPPPLVLRNTGIKVRPGLPAPVVRRTVIGPRTPTPGATGAPVYHTINGYRIDLNSAAQQETFRLPNGKLIQVKRQGALPVAPTINQNCNSWQQQQQHMQQQRAAASQSMHPIRSVQITQQSYQTVQPQPQHGPQSQQHPHLVRYPGNMSGSGASINHAVNHNGGIMQVINGQVPSAQTQPAINANTPLRPIMIRHIFPDTPIGQARSQLQEQVFNAMEICTHLTNKVQTLTNSNAYKQARNYLEVKELYIHLSYLLTYAIGRFKGLQDKCLADMRQLGFVSDADCLENGQLAAGVDYVCYGQLDDVDLFNTGSNSFHNQIYEYRKSLHANLKDNDDGAKSPLPPIFPLGVARQENEDCKEAGEGDGAGEDSLLEGSFKGHWLEGGSDSPMVPPDTEDNDEQDNDTYNDNDNDDEDFGSNNFSTTRGGTEDSMRRSEETHAFDRKLTRLVSQYPSIWCTRHPDYGNFEVTRKQWNTIASHFRYSENIKLRWKNIRKRFVRIEKRIAEGKRFNGHFDKAMAFLANRDLPEDQWVPVDCGDADGDTYDRRTLDAIERSLTLQGRDEFTHLTRERNDKDRKENFYQPPTRPIDIKDVDMRIINFVKANSVLWRKSVDPEVDKQDEAQRKTLWQQLTRLLPQYSCEDIKDRWQHLYEMYKTFRLKTIKSPTDRSLLELKYSKYLAKLYFLYKIDEQEMRNENIALFEDCFELEEDEEEEENEHTDCSPNLSKDTVNDSSQKLQDMPDDKELLQQLVRCVKDYPAIWDIQHVDYSDIMIRDNYWQEINEKLSNFQHKQASDDEDNEIEIVEPKTDLITLDSDDDEPSANRKSSISPVKKSTTTTNAIIDSNSNNAGVIHGKIGQTSLNKDDTIDLMSVAQSFLASMLEVDMSEGSNGGTQNSPNSTDSLIHKKQPRKKTTNKPNPTLIKQKEIMERERLEEMKRTDVKLKMKCSVALEKAEDVYPFAKDMLTSQKTDEEEVEEKSPEVAEHQQLGDDGTQRNSVSTMVVDTGKETVKVEVVLEDDLNTSNEGEKLEDSNVKNNEEEVLIAQPASEENNDISIVKEIEEEAILTGTEEKINEPKVDEMSNENEDLDVDKEIAKVLKDCNQRLEEEESVNNIDRSINDDSPIKICSPSPKDIRNLKDTLDRTIEKLITDDRPCKDSLTKSELSEPVISLAKEQQTVANNPDA